MTSQFIIIKTFIEKDFEDKINNILRTNTVISFTTFVVCDDGAICHIAHIIIDK